MYKAPNDPITDAEINPNDQKTKGKMSIDSDYNHPLETPVDPKAKPHMEDFEIEIEIEQLNTPDEKRKHLEKTRHRTSPHEHHRDKNPRKKNKHEHEVPGNVFLNIDVGTGKPELVTKDGVAAPNMESGKNNIGGEGKFTIDMSSGKPVLVARGEIKLI